MWNEQSITRSREKADSMNRIEAISSPGAGCIKKWLKLTMISGKVNQSEQRILYLITI